MKIAMLFSGGKDSVYALSKALAQSHELACLLTMIPERTDSYMFHVPNIALAKYCGDAIGAPHLFRPTTGIKEKELMELRQTLQELKSTHGIEGVVSGALASNYQAERIQKICDDLNLQCINPLWHINTDTYLFELLANRFTFIIVGVYAQGLTESWLGREITPAAIEELKLLHQKYKIHLGFEGGEAETLVLDCPLYKKRLRILEASKNLHGISGEYLISKAELVDKE